MNIWSRITKLAHLKITREEEENIFPQVQNIVKFFDHISQIPTKGVEPLVSPAEDPMPFRADEMCKTPDLLDSSPSKEGKFVKVPLVVQTD